MFKGGYQLIDLTKYLMEISKPQTYILTDEEINYFWNIGKNVKNKFFLGKFSFKFGVQGESPSIIYFPVICMDLSDVGGPITFVACVTFSDEIDFNINNLEIRITNTEEQKTGTAKYTAGDIAIPE